jgi:hypothetical protein
MAMEGWVRKNLSAIMTRAANTQTMSAYESGVRASTTAQYRV